MINRYSLEMEREKLITKSISRLNFIKAQDKGIYVQHVKTASRVLGRACQSGCDGPGQKLISSTIDTYRKYAGNLYIVEGEENMGVAKVRSVMQAYKARTGKTPKV